MENNEISRNKIHEYAMICIFQHLFYASRKEIKDYKNIEEIIADVMEKPFSECDDFFKVIVFETLKDKKELIDLISENLSKKWRFDRLNLVEQAILLVFSSEILNRRVEKQIAINTAINLSKKYCDDNSYKFINAVLDKLGNNYEY